MSPDYLIVLEIKRVLKNDRHRHKGTEFPLAKSEKIWPSKLINRVSYWIKYELMGFAVLERMEEINKKEEEGALSYSIISISINNPRKYLFGDYNSNNWFT